VLTSELHNGYLQHLLTMNCRVFIPLVCKKCGKCCREVGVDLSYFDPYSIAKHLKLDVSEVVTRYLGEVAYADEKSIKFGITKPRLPCPFLADGVCTIYPIRPGPCRSFPIVTDFGDHRIGCPARQEASRAERALGRGIPYYTTPICDKVLQARHTPFIKKNAWERIESKYLKTNPSDEALRIFLSVNEAYVSS